MNKLSTLIREGSKLRPQCIGGFFEPITEPDAHGRREYGSCVMGCAYEVCATRDDFVDADDIDVTSALKEATGINLYKAQRVHPVTLMQDSVYFILYNLNDIEEWSRERIADWLESEGL